MIQPVTASRRSSRDEEYELEIFKLTATGPQKKEYLCMICETAGDLIECEGPCQSYYHTDCLGLSVAPTGTFRCDECQTGMLCGCDKLKFGLSLVCHIGAIIWPVKLCFGSTMKTETCIKHELRTLNVLKLKLLDPIFGS